MDRKPSDKSSSDVFVTKINTTTTAATQLSKQMNSSNNNKFTTSMMASARGNSESIDLDSEFDGIMQTSATNANQTMKMLNVLRKNRQLCDLILQLDDDSQDIYCHQIILACNSKFFMEIFNSYESEQFNINNNSYSNNNNNNNNSDNIKSTNSPIEDASSSSSSTANGQHQQDSSSSRVGSTSPTDIGAPSLSSSSSLQASTTRKALKNRTLQQIVKANHNSTQRQLLFCLSDYLRHYLNDDSLHHDAKLNSVINHNSHYHHHYNHSHSIAGGDAQAAAAINHQENKHLMNQNLDYEALKVCIEFFYTSQLKVPSYLIPHVYTLAYHLSFDYIVEACVDYLTKRVNVDNCLSIRSFALDEQLIEASTQCIEKNIEYILKLSRSNSCSSLNEQKSLLYHSNGGGSGGGGCLDTSAYISSSLNLANKEFNHLRRINIELVGVKSPTNKLPDNINSLNQLCMNWLVEQYLRYDMDKESYLNDLCDHLNMLYINRSDLTLHDCCDMDSSDVGFTDHIHDYQQQMHHGHSASCNNLAALVCSTNTNGTESAASANGPSSSRKNSTRQSPSNGGGLTINENARLKTFKITDHELNSIGTATPIRVKILHDNEVICCHQTSDHSFVTICTLTGRLVTLNVHIFTNDANNELNDSNQETYIQNSFPNDSSNGSAASNNDGIVSSTTTEHTTNGSSDRHSPTATSPAEQQQNSSNFLYHKQASLEYSRMAKMSVARASHGCVSYDNRLYIIGGYERGECLNSCEVFDPLRNTIEPLEFMQNRRGRAAIAWSEKEKSIYVIGGSDGHEDLNSIEYFDMVSSKWKHIKFDFDLGCTNLGAIACQEYIYLVGLKGDGGKSTSCLRYEPSKNEFTRLAELNNGRSQSALVWVPAPSGDGSDEIKSPTNSLLFIFGGHDQIRCLNSCEVYDVEQDKWSMLPGMSDPRRGCGAAVHNPTQQVFIVGGTNGSQSLRSVEIYDIAGKKWHKGPDLNVARTNVAIAFIGNILIATGGFDGKSFLRTIEYLNVNHLENGWSMFHKPADFEFIKNQ